VLSRRRQATVITLIHRQETMSFLGIPIARYIDIDDAQSILRAINETPPERGDRGSAAHARRARSRRIANCERAR